MEILPLGPVVITDTAGIDDTSELGALRDEKSEEIIKKSISLSMCCVMMEAPTADDMIWLNTLKQNNVPIALFINEINALMSESAHDNDSNGNDTNLNYVDAYPDLSAIATVVGSTDFTSNRDRLTLLDLLGGLTPLDVEGEQSLLQRVRLIQGILSFWYVLLIRRRQRGRLILPQVPDNS